MRVASDTRDSISGMDYAVNRYHMPGNGRFSSPDPYAGSGGVVDPSSWNRYAYAGGDPIDGNDPFGEFTCHFQSYVKNGEEHGALHVSATCSTAYADMGWAANYGSIFQSYSIDFRPGSGTTTEQAEAYAKSLEQKYEMGIFNSYLRSQAKRAVSEISNDCDSVLQWAGISPSALANSALSVNFYDGTQSYNGQQSMAAWGNYPPTSVSWYLYHVANAFVDTNTFNDVMLGPSALPWSNGFNAMTLVHELLHTYTGLSDVALANRLGCSIVGGCSEDIASHFIKGILDQGCHRLWATIQQKY